MDLSIKSNVDICVGIAHFVQQRLYQIHSENLVQYFYADFDKDSGSMLGVILELCIASEYVQASVLAVIQDFGRLQELRTAQILKQVLEGVRYLHDVAQVEA